MLCCECWLIFKSLYLHAADMDAMNEAKDTHRYLKRLDGGLGAAVPGPEHRPDAAAAARPPQQHPDHADRLQVPPSCAALLPLAVMWGLAHASCICTYVLRAAFAV